MNDMENQSLEGIAIIGMAARVPGAHNLAEFWWNLSNGVESISFFTDEELIAAGNDPALVRKPNYIKAGGILGDADLLDAAFFGLHPREAALMDPQHRLFLQCAWEALEHAGYSPDTPNKGRVSVFAGQSMNTYLLANVYSHIAHAASAESLQASIGNDKDSLTTEVAYRLNLTGPAVTIQSSSSTSLVAVHYACQSLLSYECDVALAGGVSIHFPEKAGYLYYEGGTTSADGHCRAFDAKAQGFVAGHGAGVVVLKRLANALADGDTIYAVIKGSAVNNDGSLKVSYMAPTVDGQAEVIALAQAVAGVEPESISYVEAHGTATLMGDPIEISALTQAFRAGTAKKRFCAIGSVKTNIGHLDAAAGVVGLIKTTLALHHKLIPPSLHFEQPNPNLDLDNSPFYVNTRLAEWVSDGRPRRAGVSSFGMGGTNAHAILEEAPASTPSGPSRPAQLLLLSARSAEALDKMTTRLAEHMCQDPALNLADVAYTLHVGRKRFHYRRMLVCHDPDDAVSALSTLDPERVFSSFQEPKSRPISFMFSGQGAQYVNMGRGLYESEPAFRDSLDACCERLEPHLGLDLRTLLYPPEERAEAATAQLMQTALTQPALFAIEYALARLWMDWGVRPQSLIGHSIGEYVAACLAGVLTLDDALALVAARGRVMQHMPGGAMLGVALSEQEVQPYLTPALSLAAVNGPTACVLSGPHDVVDDVQRRLEANNVKCRRLHTSHAFHSAMMEPALPAFREQAYKVRFNPPALPYLSNVTGRWITAAEATSPDYWVKHLRQTVRFADGVGELLQDPDAILLEVGPGQTLTSLARQHPAKGAGHVVLPSLRHPQERQTDLDFTLHTLGRLWLAGVEPDWPAFYAGEQRHHIPLPTYPFERQRYWVEPKDKGAPAPPPVDQKLAVADWFYLPSWKRTLAPRADLAEPAAWLILTVDGLGEPLEQGLAQAARSPVVVAMGARFERLDERHFVINPHEPADYAAVLKQASLAGQEPVRILHLWGATPPGPAPQVEAAPAQGVYSLLFLTQALAGQGVTAPVHITLVTTQAHDITDDDVRPEKAAALGLCKVIPQEYPNITCKAVDVSWPAEDWQAARLAEHLLAESAAGRSSDAVIAYRGLQRWVQTFERAPSAAQAPLRERGVYLITGGFGVIGSVLAEELARRVQARLVLVGRSVLPARETWAGWLQTHDELDATSRKIRQVQALEALGAEVMAISADVAERQQMQTVVDQARARFGAIHGVIHAAGTIDQGLYKAIQNTDAADVQAMFRPKAGGACVLEDVLRGQPLDFCVLFSSLAAVLGGLGLAAYASANAFLDAFVCRHNRTEPIPWLSVNWDAWLATATSARQERATPVGQPLAELAITPAEGIEAFYRLLALGPAGQIAVSTSSLPARFSQWVTLQTVGEVERAPEADAARHPRPALQNAYVAPRNDLERRIAQVWQEVLGIQQVGVYDNFFELGGNSLAGVQLIARLKETLGVQLPTVSLYEGPTIHTMTRLIQQEGEAPAYEDSRGRGERRRERRQRKHHPQAQEVSSHD